MVDSFGRKIDYLRVSVTDRCNLRCAYCMPDRPFEWIEHNKILSFENIFSFVKIAIDNGIEKIRITGGEPLVRKGVENFVGLISKYAPNIDLAMTSNGVLLSQKAEILKQSGLKRVNISLDTLKPEIFEKISKRNLLDEVLKGIDKAVEVGFKVKLNCVVVRGINENEISEILNFGISKNAEVRFIEFMQNSHALDAVKCIGANEILEILSRDFKISPLKKDPHSPSSLFLANDKYRFGIISPHGEEFCKSCNRIRLSAEGLLIPCLYFDEAMSIKKALADNDFDEVLRIFESVVANKPEKNRWAQSEVSNRAFYETGG